MLAELKEHFQKQAEAMAADVARLGPSFFEEVEDVKYALHRALRRNEELETLLMERSG